MLPWSIAVSPATRTVTGPLGAFVTYGTSESVGSFLIDELLFASGLSGCPILYFFFKGESVGRYKGGYLC